MKISFLLTAAFAAFASGDSASAKKTPPPPPPATIAELEARIQKVLDSTHTPGMGLAIVRHDSVIFTGAVGKSRVSPAKDATAATLFRIGSTSKQFTALTAVALEREGKLTLQDPVHKHLPDFYYKNPWDGTNPVRIVNLLEHTSGFDDNSLMAYALNDPALPLARALALDSATHVSRWRPGTRFSYSNSGPAIVALIIEKIEGKPFEQVIQERWFTPIGMATATYFRPDTTRVDAATLYRDDGRTPVPYWHVFARPAGAINASALDMAAYLRFLLGRGTINGVTLLPPESIERMERSETWLGAREGLTVGYGLHLYRLADTLGFVWVSHNGGVEGGISDLSYLPDDDVGYAYQINTASAAAAEEITHLVRAFVTRGLTPRPVPPRGTVPASVQKEFSGWYHSVSPRQQHLYFLERLLTIMRVTVSDSALHSAPLAGKPMDYLAADPMHFRRDGQAVATLVLVHDAVNGRPEGIENFGGSLGGSLARISDMEAYIDVALAAGWLIGLALTILAALFGAMRWMVRRLRKRTAPAAAAAPLWRMAMLGAALIVMNLICVVVASSQLRLLGTASVPAVAAYLSGLLFALASFAGLAFVLRGRKAETWWGRFSGLVARAVLVLNAVAAVYLAYWGYIGWRTWV